MIYSCVCADRYINSICSHTRGLNSPDRLNSSNNTGISTDKTSEPTPPRAAYRQSKGPNCQTKHHLGSSTHFPDEQDSNQSTRSSKSNVNPKPSRLLQPVLANLHDDHLCSVHGLCKFHRDKSMNLPQQKCRLNETACEEQLSATKCCPMIDGALRTATMTLLHATSRKKETRTLLECFNMHILMMALGSSRKTQNALGFGANYNREELC